MPRVNPVGTNPNSRIRAAVSGGATREESQDRVGIGGRLLDLGNMRSVENCERSIPVRRGEERLRDGDTEDRGRS